MLQNAPLMPGGGGWVMLEMTYAEVFSHYLQKYLQSWTAEWHLRITRELKTIATKQQRRVFLRQTKVKWK